MAETKQDIMEVKDGRLVIDVALDTPVRSQSGKSNVYKTTRGNVSLNDNFVLGLNLYKKE